MKSNIVWNCIKYKDLKFLKKFDQTSISEPSFFVILEGFSYRKRLEKPLSRPISHLN